MRRKANVPPDRPTFTCRACDAALCDDCANTAAEYEFLATERGYELARLNDENDRLIRDLVIERRRAADYERIAGLGPEKIVRTWLATSAGRRALAKVAQE